MIRYLAAAVMAVLFAAPAAAQDCAQEARLRSAGGGASTSIEFRNGAKRERHIYWLDEHGKRKPYGVVQPGHPIVQKTFVSHVWVVTGPADHCMAIVTATRAPLIVDVTNPAAIGIGPAAGPRSPRTRPAGGPSKATTCNSNQVYSSSMGQCIPKAAMCSKNQVYSSSLGHCVTKVAKAKSCPYNLTRICKRLPSGKHACRCAS